MIKNNKWLHVSILMFISCLFLSIMSVVMMDIDTIKLIERITGTICVTIILYWIVSKIHISRRAKIVLIAIVFVVFCMLAIVNMSQIHNDFVGLERNKYIQLGNDFGIDKYHLASAEILFIFPLFSKGLADIMKDAGRGVMETGAILCGMQVIVTLALFGLRLASMAIVVFLNAIIVCYILKSKFRITKEKLIILLIVFGLVITAVLFFYNVFYPRTMEKSFYHYWDAIPSEIRGCLFESHFLGMNVSTDFASSSIYYDCMSPMIVTLLQFGWGPYIATLLLEIIMGYLILKIVRTVLKSTVCEVKKIITVAFATHMMLQIVMSILTSLGVPVVLPIHFPFYLLDKCFTYHFKYTVSGYADIGILTTLIIMYMGIPQKHDGLKETLLEKEVKTDEVASI